LTVQIRTTTLECRRTQNHLCFYYYYHHLHDILYQKIHTLCHVIRYEAVLLFKV